MNSPRLLILDEPTTGLDPQVRHLIWDKIRQLQKQETTVLLTTHYMEEAFQLCDRLIIMHKGQNIMEGRPENLLKENMEPYVLEVRDTETTAQIVPEKLSNRIRADRGPDVTRYYSNQIDLLKDMAASHLKTGNYLIRQTNLEDVFLKATGRQLDDKQ